MKRVWLVALSAATVTASMAVAMDDASAARRSGINRGGVHAGNINRRPAAVYRAGVNRSGLAYRSGYGNRVGWNHNWNYWGNPGLGLGLAATGLAIGATAASASAYNYDSGYYPTRAQFTGTYVPVNYIGPICDPRYDRLCQ